MGGGSGTRTAEGRLDHGGHWITAQDWPLPGTSFTPYHLHANGTLSEQPPAADATPLSYDFDPSNPVPTIGGNHSSLDPVAHPRMPVSRRSAGRPRMPRCACPW